MNTKDIRCPSCEKLLMKGNEIKCTRCKSIVVMGEDFSISRDNIKSIIRELLEERAEAVN